MKSQDNNQPHASSHLREQFQQWLDSHEPDRLQEIEIRSVESLLDALANCDDILPADYCDQLEIPKGSSYAQAVEEVRQVAPAKSKQHDNEFKMPSREEVLESVRWAFRQSYNLDSGDHAVVTIWPDGHVERRLCGGNVTCGFDEYNGNAPHEITVVAAESQPDPDPCGDWGTYDEDTDSYRMGDGVATRKEVIDDNVEQAMDNLLVDDDGNAISCDEWYAQIVEKLKAAFSG